MWIRVDYALAIMPSLKIGVVFTAALLAFVTCVYPSPFARSKTSTSHAELNTLVPFVGCESDGQAGAVEAPRGRSKAMSITADLANRLAYYKSGQGLAVLAPRGWYCFGTYGSNGAELYVNPQPINTGDLMSTKWSGFAGPAIEIAWESGDTSGRFEVARIIARVFPAQKAFVEQVMEEGIEPENSFAFGPYPKDHLTYKGKEIVEYQTPAWAEGLGTNSRLKKSTEPISGVAFLAGKTPDLVFLAVRLAPDQTGLASAIIQQVEDDAKHSHSVSAR